MILDKFGNGGFVKGGKFPSKFNGVTSFVEQLLELGADILIYNYPTYKGEQIMWQDSDRTTPVTLLNQRVGSVKNLGSLGDYLTSSGTSRPFTDAPGLRYDGINDFINNSDFPELDQPMTHLMYFEEFADAPGNDYPVDSRSGSTLRHQPFGRLADAPAGRLISAAPSATTGQVIATTTDTFSGRWVSIMDGNNSQGHITGDINASRTDMEPGTNGMQGVIIGSNRNLNPSKLVVGIYARFPRVLTQDEIDSLPLVTPKPFQRQFEKFIDDRVAEGAVVVTSPLMTYKGQPTMWQDEARTTPVTEIGQPVGSIKNFGTLGGYLTASGSQRPVKLIDGVRLDGTDDTLHMPSEMSGADDGDFTIIYYHRMPVSFGSNEYFLGAFEGSSTATPHIRTQAVSSYGFISNFGSDFVAANIAANRNPYATASFVLSREGTGANSASLRFRFSDRADYDDTGDTGSSLNIKEMGTIGSNRGTGNFLEMDLLSLVMYDRKLSTSEVNQLPNFI